MIALHSSAVTAIFKHDEDRKAREERMRNALEILAAFSLRDNFTSRGVTEFVRATAREGLGRETE
jgi:hypothetical protein